MTMLTAWCARGGGCVGSCRHTIRDDDRRPLRVTRCEYHDREEHELSASAAQLLHEEFVRVDGAAGRVLQAVVVQHLQHLQNAVFLEPLCANEPPHCEPGREP
jgi:hypothetical protein